MLAIVLGAGFAFLVAVYLTAPGDVDNVLMMLVASLVVVTVILAGLAVGAYQRERRFVRSGGAPSQGGEVTPAPPTESERRKRPAGLGASVQMVAIGLEGGQLTRLPVPVVRSSTTKVCPECDREFQTSLESCPFDQVALVPKTQAESEPVQRDQLDTRRVLARCNKCRRAYDMEARFCIRDGAALERVEEEAEIGVFDGEMGCNECGARYDRDARYCAEDHSRLVPAAFPRLHPIYADIPLCICPGCLREYQIGPTRCADCDVALLPVIGRVTGGFPAQGVGQLLRHCPECGTRHGDDADFCHRDGSPLNALN